MPKAAHKVVVIGHRNPDTDSICSAIAYAELKNKTSDLVCEARRAGRMNQETEFVLKKFGVTPPRMCTDVNPKIRDVDYREMPGIPGATSLRRAWEIMRDQKIDTLPITSAENDLEGIITVKDIATANMDVFDTGVLAKSQTSFRNILETLGGTMVVGDENAVCTTGHIKIGTATPEMLESNVEKGDIVILTNRYESQLCAIEKEASLLIICNGSKVGHTIQRIADEMGVAIMTTPYDTYAAGKLISQCAPISYYMTREDILKFTLVTPVADVMRVMAKVRHRYFPILDEEGKYCGMVSRRNIIALRKRRIILVDHNEVFLQDFKVFMCGDIRFGVAQGSYMTRKNLLAAEKLLKPYLEEARNKQNVEDIYMLLTDVPKEESVVICAGRYAAEVLSDGFETQPAEDGSWTLPGVVSRKKQFIPAMMSAYQEL